MEEVVLDWALKKECNLDVRERGDTMNQDWVGETQTWDWEDLGWHYLR